MIDLKVSSIKNPRDDGYGWNLYVLSIARMLFHEPAAEITLHSPSSANCAVPHFRGGLKLFIVRDRSEQRHWAVVAGNDLAIRGGSCARAADRKGHVLDQGK
jgi:hypothetical protein